MIAPSEGTALPSAVAARSAAAPSDASTSWWAGARELAVAGGSFRMGLERLAFRRVGRAVALIEADPPAERAT